MMKLKIALARIATFFAVFLIALNIFSGLLNMGNTDLTSDMMSASLPIVYMNINDVKINALHGYTEQMEGNFLRGNITPINADRSLNIIVDTFGTSVAKVAFEVRNLECTRLIEDGELESFEFNDNIISAKLKFKDLIKDETEYMLVIKLVLGDGKIASYYTRIINTTEISLMDKLLYCLDFSEKTFDPTKAPELKKYMESNSQGDNSSYGYVNIHSNYNQLIYGGLEPEVVSDKFVNLISVDSLNGCVELLFTVKIKDELYNVKEYFRVRQGNERMYLMEYERTMNQIITNEKSLVINNKIINGIVNEKIKYTESPSKSITAFVQQNSLYSVNTQTGSLTRIFSYRDADNDDARTNFNGHAIKIMNVDESGNVSFIVYGYMNRGIHEGAVGVALYYYDAVVNTIEEQVFIPYTKSFELLKQDIEKLSYINSRDRMYLLIDGAVYSINLELKEVETIARNLDENRFVSSKDNSIIAWQTGEEIVDYNSIQYYSLNQLSPEVINAPAGSIIVPLGFINEDLVYGTAKISDITTDFTGRRIVPMNKITIEAINKKVLKEYKKENIYIVDVSISDEMINLVRLKKDEETEKFAETTDDQIITNSAGSLTYNALKSVITEEMETTYQIVLAKEGSFDKVKVLNPKVVLFEDNRGINLSNKDNVNRYYVYAKGKLIGAYISESEAVTLAENLFGVVVNKKMDYIWESAKRKSKTSIDTIGGRTLTQEQIENGLSPITVCLQEMLEYREIYKDTDRLLTSNNTVLSVLKENVDADVLDLAGCTLDSILYYVNKGNPVMAMTEENNAVIIVGYDPKNVIIYSPLSGEVFKKGMNDSKAFFEGYGNKYVTYIN